MLREAICGLGARQTRKRRAQFTGCAVAAAAAARRAALRARAHRDGADKRRRCPPGEGEAEARIAVIRIYGSVGIVCGA